MRGVRVYAERMGAGLYHVGMSGSAYRRKDGVIVCPLSVLRP